MDEIQTNNQSPAQQPVAPKKKMSKQTIGLLSLLVLVILAGGGYLLINNYKSSHPTTTPTPAPVTPTPTTTNSSEPLISGMIDWQYPKSSYLDILKPNADTSSGAPTFNQVGTFKSGQYQGKILIVASVPCEGPCPMMTIRFVADDPASSTSPLAKPVVLKKYSDPLDNINLDLVDNTKYTVDSTTVISDLEAPATLSGSTASQKLELAQLNGFQTTYNVFNVTNLKLVYTDPKVGPVYTTPDDPSKVDGFFATYGFYVKMPDWNTVIYKYVPNFVGSDSIPSVTWTGNAVNKDEYQYVHIGGCGAGDYGAVVTNSVKISDLTQTGKTSTGDSVYEFKDSNAQMLKDMYDNDYHPYNTSNGQDDPSLKISYSQFVAAHPMFFWTDPFGRLIQFKNTKFIISNAECGKPVIYLYPTKAENVNVKLAPSGGFSFTEPDYGTGWNVLAKPDGELTNLVDGKIYPYLFWEGRSSDIYQTPDKGFVVAKQDVHSFLNEKLAKLGLNTQETSDFEQYWEPKMTSAPYYFVTFMGNSVMDRIAPLNVSPKPDTVIRILMDFKPLDKPVSVQGYEIKTPVRSGFTVVEWGGVLR